MIKVAFSKRSAARSIAEKVAVLMEVKSFSLKEWISEKNTEKLQALSRQKEKWEAFGEQCFKEYNF